MGFSMKGAGAKEEKAKPREEAAKGGKKRIVDSTPVADLSLMLNEAPGVKTELAFFYNFESRAATQAMLRQRGGGRSEPMDKEMKEQKQADKAARDNLNMYSVRYVPFTEDT